MPKPPYIDPKFPARYRTLVDSLARAVGTMPDSLIYERPLQDQASGADGVLANYNPKTGAMRLSPQATDPRRRLMHEFGHVLQFKDQPEFYNWFDPSGTKTPERSDLERFSDNFADAFSALSQGKTTAHDAGVNSLVQYLTTRPPFAPQNNNDALSKALLDTPHKP